MVFSATKRYFPKHWDQSITQSISNSSYFSCEKSKGILAYMASIFSSSLRTAEMQMQANQMLARMAATTSRASTHTHTGREKERELRNIPQNRLVLAFRRKLLSDYQLISTKLGKLFCQRRIKHLQHVKINKLGFMLELPLSFFMWLSYEPVSLEPKGIKYTFSLLTR